MCKNRHDFGSGIQPFNSLWMSPRLLFGLVIPLSSLNLFSLGFLSLQTQETREILHFHYTTWPDFGVPESPASFLNFLFKVRESGCLNSDQGPVVVHCSAGIGRSGTFCLVDTCLLLVCAEPWHSIFYNNLADNYQEHKQSKTKFNNLCYKQTEI